jgi:hypothetical protein
MAYINTYEKTREFAGCEEGGRFGTVYTLIDSKRIRGGIWSERAAKAFNAYLKANGHNDTGYFAERGHGFYRSNGQIDCLVVKIEPGLGRDDALGFGQYE